MIGPDPRLLGFLLAVSEHGSFNRAAAALGMSQPALSLKIAQLERQVNVLVFDRGPRGATLTAHGKLLLHHARVIEAVRQRAAHELDLSQRGSSGTLMIGATVIALVPEALNQLDREVGRLTVNVAEGSDAELNDQLRRREIDIIVGAVGVEAMQSGVRETSLLKDRLDLVLAPGSDLDSHKKVNLKDLQNRNWIIPTKGSYFRRQVESLFIVAGVPFPNNAMFCDSFPAIRSIAIHGDRLAILPRLAVRSDIQDRLLTAIPLSNPGAVRNIGYRLRESEVPLPLCLRFIDLLKEVAKRIEATRQVLRT